MARLGAKSKEVKDKVGSGKDKRTGKQKLWL